jgi:hypothetical protein
MTQADSVHSTPPTNAPIDTTRRRLLTVAAGGAVAAAIPTAALTAAPAADPIYAAIDAHRERVKTYDAAWKLRARCKDFGTLTEAEKARVRELNDATDAAGLPLEAAAMDLFNTVPTTHAGIIAALFYMRIQHRNDGEHMIQGWLEDEDGDGALQLDDAAVLS